VPPTPPGYIAADIVLCHIAGDEEKGGKLGEAGRWWAGRWGEKNLETLYVVAVKRWGHVDCKERIQRDPNKLMACTKHRFDRKSKSRRLATGYR
jgi:hypothetical protein